MRPMSFIVSACLLFGCRPNAPTPAPGKGEEKSPKGPGIALGDLARRNLGITFAKVEYRKIGRSLEIAGRLESSAAAHMPVSLPLSGQVQMQVSAYQPVRRGDLLGTLSSPQWNQLQAELAEAREHAHLAAPRLAQGQEMLAGLEESRRLWSRRLELLETAKAELGTENAELLAARSELARLKVEIGRQQTELLELVCEAGEEGEIGNARQRYLDLLARAAAFTGQTQEQLESSEKGQPLWRRLDKIELRAAADGIVGPEISAGGWLEAASVIATLQVLGKLHFRSALLQREAGLAALATGRPAELCAVDGQAWRLPAVFSLPAPADGAPPAIHALTAPGAALPPSALAGTPALLMISLEDAKEELALPNAALIRDGLKTVFFRRNPKNPDEVLRMEADTGLSDGRFTQILSGLREGDEVVLGGIYPLKLSSSGSDQKAGHFHSDGTFHAEEH